MSDINWKNKFKNYSKKDIKKYNKKIKKITLILWLNLSNL